MTQKKNTLSKKKKLKNSLIKDLISIIRYQEGYIDKLDETYYNFYNQFIQLAHCIRTDREHYNKQVLNFVEIAKSFEANQKTLEANQKILEEDVRKSNAMLRMAWVAEDMDIDTKSDFIKFTAKEKLEYKNDFEVEINTKQLESGKRIDQMVLKKKKRPQLKTKQELQNDK